MTTGRINQVTILSPGAAVRRGPGLPPPRGSGGALRELGTAEADPAGQDHRAGRGGRRPTIQLPPLSSPKGGPPGGYRVDDHQATRHAPLRWRVTAARSTPLGGYWQRHSPRRPWLRIVASSQPSTGPINVPADPGANRASVPAREPVHGANKSWTYPLRASIGGDLARGGRADQS